MNGVHNVGKQSIISGVDTLNQVLQSEGMSLSVVPGAEIHVNTALPSMYESDELVTINSTEYVLVEFPMQGIPYGFEEVYFQLRLRGARLVIAHPERYQQVQRHPESLDPYLRMGALVQITASALLGHFGGRVRKCARQLLRTDRVHLMASDAHSSRSRPPILHSAVKEAARLLKNETEAWRLVRDNPLAVLRGTDLNEYSEVLPSNSNVATLCGIR